MRREDMCVAFEIERRLVITELAYRSLTDDELVEAITADPDLMAKVLGGGRWVPWCVEHDSLRRDASGDQKAQRCQQAQLIFHWVDRLTPCVWHPQGAFIPEDEGGTT